MCRSWKNFEMYVRKSQVCLEEIIIACVGIKGDCGKVSDRNKDCVTGHRRKGDQCYKVKKNLDELFSHVLWKVRFVSDEVEYVAEEIYARYRWFDLGPPYHI